MPPQRRQKAWELAQRPYASEHERSVTQGMDRGTMPRTLPGLMRWYSDGWDAEVPTALHKAEVWRDHGQHAQGGSALGAPAHTDPFRRYLENTVRRELDLRGIPARLVIRKR